MFRTVNNSRTFGKNSTEVINGEREIQSNVQGQTISCHVGLGPADYCCRSRRGYHSKRKYPGGRESLYAGSAETEPAETTIAAEEPERISYTEQTKAPDAAQVDSGMENAVSLVLDFSDTSRMAWPVRGNVLLDYSMDTTIYFPTLEQYQVNPGVVIQAEVSQPVAAPANARVVAVSADEELGNFIVLDLGNDYTATCGQLKEIQVVENEYLEAGQVIGYVAEPTKYYSVEGSNVYFQLEHEGKKVDPIDYFE